MSDAPGHCPGVWPRWALEVVGYLAIGVAGLLSTGGWFGAAFGIGSNCTDKFSCGSGSCSPCSSAHAWVLFGGLGQWALLAATVGILVLGLRRPDWRRAATTVAAATILLSIGWYATYTSVANRAY